MAYPLLQVVSAPDPAATLRYDFNIKTATYHAHLLAAGGFDLGVPEWTGDPQGVGGSFNYRPMRFTQRIEGTRTVALARLSALAKVLLRDENWLKVQWSADVSAVYFKLYRGSPGDLSLENAEPSQAWDMTVPLVADPFAYSPRVTLSPITINNDPVAGSNPCRAVLPTIVGDAPAPLMLSVDPSNTTRLDGYRHMFAVNSTYSSVAGPIVWQIGGSDGWTAGTDTSASEFDGNFSGSNRRSVTFNTVTTMATRISGLAPATLPSGRYRAFLRFGRAVASNSKHAFRLGVGGGYGPTAVVERGATTTTTLQTWVDLGDFTHPFGHNAPKGQEGVARLPVVDLQVQKFIGGAVRLDCFLIVPIDSTDTIQNRMLFSEQNQTGVGSVSGSYGVWNGDTESAYAFNSSGQAETGFIAEMMGGFPEVVPGAVNTLHFLQQVSARDPADSSLDASDDITVSTVLTPSYYPRWLHIGDGT
jgi:hypothetical protein